VKLNAYPEIIGIATQWSNSLDDLMMGAGMCMGKFGAPAPMQARHQPQLLDNSLLITLLMLSTQLRCLINQVTLVAGYVLTNIVSR